MAHKFVIRKDKKGESRVSLVDNGETVFATKGYSSKSRDQEARPRRPDGRPDRLTSPHRRGKVTPRWPIYLPARSA
jgi:IS5 family transposase